MSKGEMTKQLIIEKAAPIFNTKGLAATSMSDIMEVTKLSKGSLYVHFENKDVLAAHAVDYNMNLLSSKIKASLDKQASYKNKLFAYLDYFEKPLEADLAGGCPMLNFGMEADDTNPFIKLKVHREIQKTEKMLADLVEEGIKNGEFNASWNYKEFATMLFAMVEGGILMSRVAGNIDKMKVINHNLKKMITEQTL